MIIDESAKIKGILPLYKRRKLIYNKDLNEQELTHVLILYSNSNAYIIENIIEIEIMKSEEKYYEEAYCWIHGGGRLTILFLKITEDIIEFNYRKDGYFCDFVPSRKFVQKIIKFIKLKIIPQLIMDN